MFSSERDELRKTFFNAWQKHLQQLPIEPIEAEIIDVILHHPEYHALLSSEENFLGKDFETENPFLHMSLHLALREQIKTNRPAGISKIFSKLSQRLGDELIAEHLMLEPLAQMIWDAQKNHKMPDENEYLELLLKL